MRLKQLILSNRFIYRIATSLISFFGRNKIRGRRKNCIQFNGARLKRCRVSVNGNNNTILLEEGCKLIGSTIQINGNDNVVRVGKDSALYGVKITVEDNENQVEIGPKTVVYEDTEFAVTEGTRIMVGDSCLISSEVDVRTGDSHSILNEFGERINQAKDIVISNHVWIGTRATLLKGSTLGENCVVATGAIVTKTYMEEGCVLAGVPAKIVEKGINWNETR